MSARNVPCCTFELSDGCVIRTIIQFKTSRCKLSDILNVISHCEQARANSSYLLILLEMTD